MNKEKDVENIVWQRILANEGNVFTQVLGQQFTYTVSGNALTLSTTNQNVARSQIEKAIHLMPAGNTVPLQSLRAPSYLYAILMDARIREGLW
jgi:hypothetical protein